MRCPPLAFGGRPVIGHCCRSQAIRFRRPGASASENFEGRLRHKAAILARDLAVTWVACLTHLYPSLTCMNHMGVGVTDICSLRRIQHSWDVGCSQCPQRDNTLNGIGSGEEGTHILLPLLWY